MRPIRSAAGRLDRLAGTDSEEEVLEKGHWELKACRIDVLYCIYKARFI